VQNHQLWNTEGLSKMSNLWLLCYIKGNENGDMEIEKQKETNLIREQNFHFRQHKLSCSTNKRSEKHLCYSDCICRGEVQVIDVGKV
jgi:hypothetical protein